MCMSSHIHPISPSVINQHSTACGSIISRGGGERPPVVHGVYKTTVVHEGLRIFCQIQKILIRTKDRIKRILRDKNLTCEIHYAKKSLLLLITLTLIKGALRSKYIENKPSMFFLHTVENR